MKINLLLIAMMFIAFSIRIDTADAQNKVRPKGTASAPKTNSTAPAMKNSNSSSETSEYIFVPTPDPFMPSNSIGTKLVEWAYYLDAAETSTIPRVVIANTAIPNVAGGGAGYFGFVPKIGENGQVNDVYGSCLTLNGKKFLFNGETLVKVDEFPEHRLNDFHSFSTRRFNAGANSYKYKVKPVDVQSVAIPVSDTLGISAPRPQLQKVKCTITPIAGSNLLTLTIGGKKHTVMRELGKNAEPDAFEIFDRLPARPYLEKGTKDGKTIYTMFMVEDDMATIIGDFEPNQLGRFNPE